MRSDNRKQDRFYELLGPVLPRLQAFCQKLVGDTERANDLLQDSLYDAWRGFHRLRADKAFRAWLYQIVINRYRTHLRQFRKQLGRTVLLTDDIADDRSARLHDARHRLNVAMAGMSPQDRALVTLHELEGWSYPELTGVFGRSEGSLRTRLTRCRKRMRKTLAAYLRETEQGLPLTGVTLECVVAKPERS